MKNYSVICTLLFTFISQLSAQTITTQPTNQAVLAGGNVTFSVAVSGTAPFTYQWQFNGTNLPSGIITTVAGNGNGIYSPFSDFRAATNTGMSPTGVAVDASGNLFIADRGNSRIRKVDNNGIILTVAGNGIPSYSTGGGIATSAELWDPPSVAVDEVGNLLIADENNNFVRKVDTNGFIGNVVGAFQYGGFPVMAGLRQVRHCLGQAVWR